MSDDREDVYSKAVRAGKRTYFFDVKSTRGGDLFLTITESKKYTHEDGTASYDKHKIFLYKEDFDKFVDGMHDALDEIDRLHGPRRERRNKTIDDNDRSRNDQEDIGFSSGEGPVDENAARDRFTDIKFEDLDGKPE